LVTADRVHIAADAALPADHRTYVRTDTLRRVLESVRDVATLPSDLAEDVDRCIASLTPSTFVSTGMTARLLGYSSINSVKHLHARGLLPGGTRTSTGRWIFPLDSVLAARDFNLSGMRLPRATGNAFDESEPEV
jgi:hypothetical protein